MAMNFFNFALLLLTFSSFGACYQIVTSDNEIPSRLRGYVSVTASSIDINPSAPELDLVLNGQKMMFQVNSDENGCRKYNFDFLNGRCTAEILRGKEVKVNKRQLTVLSPGAISFAIENGQVSLGLSTVPCYVATEGVFKLKATVDCPTTITGVSLVIPSASTPSTAAPAISTSATASSTSSITATSDIFHGSASSTTSAQTSTAFSFPTLSNTKSTSSSTAHAESTSATVAEGGLSIGVIAAIIAGVCLCIIIPAVFGLVYYFIIRKKCRKSAKPKTGVSLVIPSSSTPSTAAPAISTSATASSTSSITATSDISHGSATSTTSAQTSSTYSFPTLSNTKSTSSSSAHAESTSATVAEGGLSIGVIAAIVAGVCLCIIIPIVFGLVYYFIIRKKCRKSAKPKTKSKTRSIVKTAPGGIRGNKSVGDTAGNQSKAKNAPSRFMVNLTGYGNTLLPDNPNEAIELIILKVLSSCRLRSDAQKYDVFDGKLFSNADEFADAILEECRPLFIEYLNTRYELQNHEVDEGTILTIVESLVTPEAVKKGIADARQSAFGYEMLGPIVEGLPSKVATAKPKEGPYHNMSEIRNEGRVFKAITGRKRRPSG
uniref:Uncharacterized protein n=1 Tax=Panagrolaimus sp. ES5 TaxID=591445 RepID=A0AC34GTL8_9BILA